MKDELEIASFRIFKGDADRLRELHGHRKSSIIVRHLIRRHIKTIENAVPMSDLEMEMAP
jgi:hypothetical protein